MKRIMQAVTVMGVMIVSCVQATLYDVDRSFTDGTHTGTLVGTVDIPMGSYTIMNASASPFTGVNLTLTVNGTDYSVNNVLTGIITGSGQFIINASATTLTFSTANADMGNPADLVFSDTTDPSFNDRYVIGYNGSPGFEAAYTGVGFFAARATLPTVFGTTAVVPEPSTAVAGALLLLPFGASALRMLRKRQVA